MPAVDVTNSAFKAGAYAYYARLRAEAPVHPVKLPNGHVVWLVSRYDDVAALLKDPRLAKDQRNAQGSRPFSRLPGMLGFLHAIERMRSRVESLADELLSKALSAGNMDLIAGYALPIPATVISEMLGIPPADQRRFHKWSSVIVASTAGPNPVACAACHLEVRALHPPGDCRQARSAARRLDSGQRPSRRSFAP